ncbi:hypothetical protein GGS21DRAFT_494383 [Xylaria nigripes]|nr:hypothetical protein GGS21DRAFT_494383 [Xylaria nigripes]
MPSRISLPQFSTSSSRPYTPRSKSEPQMPTSHSRKSSMDSSPTSPPARLHLRNILPASPEEPAFMPPPPSMPKAWVWQCHLCLTVYRLGCTRRCLDCAHTYCMSANTPTNKTTRGKKRRRPAGLCAAMFDYAGWEQWGAWRRKVLGLESTGRCDPKVRDCAFAKNKHNCFIDCDSPSQCFQRRYELALQAMKKQARLLEEDEENEAGQNSFLRMRHGEDDLLGKCTPRMDAAENVKQAGNESSLSQSSFLWHEPELKNQKADGKAWWVEEEAEGEYEEEENKGSGKKLYNADQNAGQDDVQHWAAGDDIDVQVCAVQRSSMGDLPKGDVIEDSDSDAESNDSDWSFLSFESEASSVETKVNE